MKGRIEMNDEKSNDKIPFLAIHDLAIKRLGRLFGTDLKSNNPVYDYTDGQIVSEFELIAAKKSKLSKSQRHYVVHQYLKIAGIQKALESMEKIQKINNYKGELK